MATPNVRDNDARLNFRLRSDIKDRIEKAATVSGKSITDFAVSTLRDTADEVLERYQAAELTNHDRNILLAVLDRADKPNPALTRAAKTHRKLIVK